MADIENKSNFPFLIFGIAVGAVILYMVLKPKRRGLTDEELLAFSQGVPVDPCIKPDGTRLPDWACGTVRLLNPLAKASVDVARVQADYRLQKAAIRGY